MTIRSYGWCTYIKAHKNMLRSAMSLPSICLNTYNILQSSIMGREKNVRCGDIREKRKLFANIIRS